MLGKLKQTCYFIYGYMIAIKCRAASVESTAIRQQQRFKKLMNHVVDKAPFYRSFKDKSLSEFPIIDKPLFLANFDEMNTVGLALKQCEEHGLKAENNRNFNSALKGVSVGLSSGTSHQRGVFLVSPCEQALWAGYIIAKNIPFSFRKKRVALFLRANNNLYESANGLLINFCFFDLTKSFDCLIKELEAYSPHILIAPAHVLDVISKHQAAIKPDKIISVAEVLEDTVRYRVEEKFSCKLDEIYQATEGYIASSCAHGNLHINEDILIVEKEWIDKESGRFAPVITDLNRRTLPIIRYRLNDILIEEKASCPCGSHFTRLKKIEGREDDMLWLPDSNSGTLIAIFPDLIRWAMYICQTQVYDYRIEQHGGVITITYKSDVAEKAEQDIVSTLEELFTGLNVDKPKINFSVGIKHDLMKKQRRIACYQKPSFVD
jgi:putative adenylate-forming enzyme